MSDNLPEIAKGLSGWRRTYSCPRCHSSEGWNPGREAGMVKGRQVLPDGAFRYRFCVLSFPLCGSDLSKPPCLRQTGGFRPAPE